MMKNFFQSDNVTVGLIAGLGSEVLTAVLLYAGLAIAGLPLAGHERWFGICFVAPLLILRAYAHGKTHPVVTKTLIVTLFVTFLLFMFFLFKTKAIVL